MAELRPIPFPHLLRRVVEEPARQETIFDLPLRKVWRPDGVRDLSVLVHGHRAQTPVGPAAGPHAQLAQNIVLAWLGGSRVIELKTVQVLDELKIPRPCIDAATIGFNVEWSQELRLADSLVEYVAGWMLIDVLRHLDPIGLGAAAAEEAAPVFELSVGYDLKGLSSPAMRDYLHNMRDVGAIIDRLRAQIPPAHGALGELPYRREMVSCVTLSTFHGCPAGEIEAIARYLLDDIGVDVIVKLNPTLLGYDEVSYLLHDRMGYHELRPRRAAFEGDLRWEEAVAMGRRLADAARAVGRSFGVKMTNTLVVDNHKKFFAAEEMYLSGPPLHVLAMHCVERWRAALGSIVPLSFSGGIDQHNFADAVACDLVPVTTCTDLLRPGGYGRLPRYLENLAAAMAEVNASDRSDFLLRRFGQGAEAVRTVLAELREQGLRDGRAGSAAAVTAERLLVELEVALLAAVKPGGGPGALDATLAAFASRLAASPRAAELTAGLQERIVATAGALNAHEVTARVTGDPRYAAGKNSKPPRKVGTSLVLLDCLSCDKCVPVCPNDANFSLATAVEEVLYEELAIDDAGRLERRPSTTPWRVGKAEQWANFADACNECGNCDVFCPEDGGPYIVKARFFGTLASLEASPELDGLVVDTEPEAQRLRVQARIAGRRYLVLVPAVGPALVDDGALVAEFDAASGRLLDARRKDDRVAPPAGHLLSGAVFLTVRALVRGVLDGKRLNPVSAALPGITWP